MRRLAPGTTSAPLLTTRLVARLVADLADSDKMAAEGGNRKAGKAAVPRLPASAGQLIHGLGELDVELGEAAGIVGRQRHFDIFVDVEPFGMVIELFRHQRGTRHKAEGLIEIGKDEFFGDGVATVDLGPAFEPGEPAFARFAAKFSRHLQYSLCATRHNPTTPATLLQALSFPVTCH